MFHQLAAFLFEINTEDDQENSRNQKHQTRARHRAEQPEICRDDVQSDERYAEVDEKTRALLQTGLNLQQAEQKQREARHGVDGVEAAREKPLPFARREKCRDQQARRTGEHTRPSETPLPIQARQIADSRRR